MAGMVSLPSFGHRARPRRAKPEGDDETAADARIARYTVRLGPYASRHTALATRSRLARRGYSAVLAGRSLSLGSFSTATKAEGLATRLRRTGYHPVVVQL
jgi:cell division protein FtsN